MSQMQWYVALMVGALTFIVTALGCVGLLVKTLREIFQGNAAAGRLDAGEKRMDRHEKGLEELNKVSVAADKEITRVCDKVGSLEGRMDRFEDKLDQTMAKFLRIVGGFNAAE